MYRKNKTHSASRERSVPPISIIGTSAKTAYFHDCHEIAIARTNLNAQEIYMRITADTPEWINTLMTIRNRAVALLKLKNVGNLGQFARGSDSTAYSVGDRLDLFTIRSLSDDELVMGIDDSHLNVQISVLKLFEEGTYKVAITTVVDIHNRIGKAYMFFVTPFHRRIVKSMLSRSAPVLNALN